jgi:TPR repeat protein
VNRRALAAAALALLVGCVATAESARHDHASAVEAPGIDHFDHSAPRLPGARPPDAGSEAADAIRRKAAAGDRDAQSHLGVMYRMGRGVPQDDARSFRWFREAALAGDPAAQHYLGLFYLSGVGTEIDLDEATRWLRGCADLNQPERLMSLAWFTLKDNGLPHGAVHTAALLRNLAEQGNAAAQYSLGIFRRDRPDDTAEEDGETWLRQSAERGYAEAQFQLGLALLEGSKLSGDPDEAVAWFRFAAEQGHPRAMRNLGVARWTGRGVAADAAIAFRWFWLAARHGSAIAVHDVRHLEGLLAVDLLDEARDAGLAWERAHGLAGRTGASPRAP